MPYPNEHACRLETPDKYKSFARENCGQKHDGKCIDVIYGIPEEGGSEIQALRYKTDIWTEDAARNHCKSRDGSFEPAKKAEGKSMKLNYRNQKNAEATAKYWNKSLEKPDWYKIEALSEDEAEIMIYDVIGWPFNDAAELVRALGGMNQKTITIRINSPGGDVFDSMSIFNALQSHKSKIITRIEALAASSASFIALAGKEVQSYKNAMMMIHDPWVLAVGNQYDLREIADVLDKISGNMVDIYSGKSDVGKKEIKEMMKAETWLNAKEMKEKGFVDTILDGKGAKAQFDLSVFFHCPEDLWEEDKELTERDAEKILRDAGFSRHKAKSVLARRKDGEGKESDPVVIPIVLPQDDSELIAALKNNLKLFGGN